LRGGVMETSFALGAWRWLGALGGSPPTRRITYRKSGSFDGIRSEVPAPEARADVAPDLVVLDADDQTKSRSQKSGGSAAEGQLSQLCAPAPPRRAAAPQT
jgi:hypothetical protein